MKREFLQELGLEKEAIDKIMDENGKDINAAKLDYDTVKGQLDTANQTISGLQEAAKKLNGEALQTKLTELQEKYDSDTQSLQQQLTAAQLNGALETAMAKSGARSTKALKGLLDMEKIAFKDGALSGFDEQLESIKKENGFLFEESPASWGERHNGQTPQKTGVEAAFERLNPNLKID